MSSLKSIAQEATTDFQELSNRRLAHHKIHMFFIFYSPSHWPTPQSHLQVLSSSPSDSSCGWVKIEVLLASADKDAGRHSFFSLILSRPKRELEACLIQKCRGLKVKTKVISARKTKIIVFSSESGLMELIKAGNALDLDMTTIPLILSNSCPNSDLPIFSGWETPVPQSFYDIPTGELQQFSRKWVRASQEKVDLWSAEFHLTEGGRIEKLEGQRMVEVEASGYTYTTRFLSHLTIGHHATVSRKFQQRRGAEQETTRNSILLAWERFKHFCCLGPANLQTSTGVVSINFTDDRGEEVQILKHLREYEGSQESEIEASRVVRADRSVLSLVLANLDRFHGQRLDPKLGSKPGDGKLQLMVLEGARQWRRMGAAGGQIRIRIEGEGPKEVQVGDAILRLWGCRELRVRQEGRMRVSLNHQVLGC